MRPVISGFFRVYGPTDLAGFVLAVAMKPVGGPVAEVVFEPKSPIYC